LESGLLSCIIIADINNPVNIKRRRRNLANSRIIQIVASESTPEKEAEYNAWYTDIHIPMLFGYEGMKKVSRYRLVGENEGLARFLTVYEFENQEAADKFHESPDFKAAIQDFESRKDELNFVLMWAASYELTKSLER
jgi:antibiotic biosynthesis monooxygenase (ABM) superfamily enzyme